MVSNDLPQALTKNCNRKYHFVLFLYKRIGTGSPKTIPWQLLLNVGQRNFISAVTLGYQFRSFVSYIVCISTNDENVFRQTHRNVLNLIGMMSPFCGFPMIEFYQNQSILKSPNILITQSNSCIHSV